MSNVITKAQKLCNERRPTAKTWETFQALYERADDSAEKMMLDDLSSTLERNLITLNVIYGGS
ncbi:hypothetical protein HWV00_20845 (plasmid) [Moritella sp. 24]|uniref:hypothetical protein n=1 Tax=Moritella sp. 24 TaxID=2746230 RepID=UPI001BA4756B|nr:hypothetical protein [Moritella sp. 24]QUM78722.1 hypothetical protein HWV00_20845 [Moritella sp. 24]